jgi:upstream activation factor subunit UAF30
MAVGKKKTSAPKKNVAKSAPVKKVVETPPVVETPAVEPMTESVDDFMVYSELSELKDRLKMMLSAVRELSSMVVSLERRVNKDKKVADKKMKKKQPKLNPDGTKPLNGFSKPGVVSDDLRKFMGLAQDELVARVDVTKFITKYCKENNLHDEKDKRILRPDKKLQKLLKLDKETDLTYFNLQKYLKFHFPNKDGEFPTA